MLPLEDLAAFELNNQEGVSEASGEPNRPDRRPTDRAGPTGVVPRKADETSAEENR
jgi:hypothetical protein